MSENPEAIEILKQYPDRINWHILSSNPAAIEMLKENPHKINWRMLSRNVEAIDMLKANPDKIDWRMISSNPNIFVYDYEKIAKRLWVFNEELIAKAWHPKRVSRWLKFGVDVDDL